MRFGVVILPEHSWSEARHLWERAEELGFDHAWTYDHLTWRSFGDRAWFGAVPTLTAAAAATRTIRLGTLVASPNFRHPVPFAKELITLDDISGGRFTLGIGAGTPTGWDATMLGHAPWPPVERAGRFEEFVDLLDRLLRGPETTYEGDHYAAHEARTYPGCVQQPRIPFAVAATGPRGMCLAARAAETWVTTGARHKTAPVAADEGAADIAAQIEQLERACETEGRDPATIDRLVLTGPVLDSGLDSPQQWDDTVGAYEAVGVTDLVVHWPRPEPPYEADPEIFLRIFSNRASNSGWRTDHI